MKKSDEAICCLETCLEMSPGSVDVIRLLQEIKTSNNVQFKMLLADAYSFKLTKVNDEVFKWNSWMEVAEKSRNCHSPIEYVTIDCFVRSSVFGNETMKFFRAVDPICFTGVVCFHSFNFSRVLGSFDELFDGILKPKSVIFHNVSGISGKVFSKAMNSFSGMRDANSLFVDNCYISDVVMKIKTVAIIDFLHNHGATKERVFGIQANYMKIGLEGLLNKLAKRFTTDVRKSPFELRVHCLQGFPKPATRVFFNLNTNEQLAVSHHCPPLLHLNAGHHQVPGVGFQAGFTVRVVRSPIKRPNCCK